MRPQAIAVIAALLAGIVFVATRGGGEDSASTATVGVKGEVFREPVTAPGPDPFTQPVSFTATTTATATTPSTTIAPTTSASPPTTGGTIAVASTSGGTPGLYGGTLNNAECNKEQMITFLEQNADKAKAWAAIQQIQPTQIREYIGQLTPVILEADTRVTNHGFLGGQATPRQAVMQKGTAVLIDKFGEPRARCYCGNPLTAPVAQTTSATFTGPTWPAFDPGNLQVVTPAPAPLTSVTLKDENTGNGINRPIGSSGAQDTPAPPPPPLPEPKLRVTQPNPATTTASTTTAGTTTTRSTATTVATTSRPAAIPAPNAFIQKEGAVVATSTYSAEFALGLAVDGNRATSWFSKGSLVDGPTSTFTWTYSREELITLVRIVGNSEHSNVDFRRNFGFTNVVIRVLDTAGQVDFEQSVALPGTPDPDAVVQPGVRGRTVQLVFSGGEAADCGGFSELEVGVTR